jgi:DNA-binding FrmR family transcriptional regulator
MTEMDRAIVALGQALAAMRTSLAFMSDKAIQDNLNEFVLDRLIREIHDCSQGILLSIESLQGKLDELKKEVVKEAVESSDVS